MNCRDITNRHSGTAVFFLPDKPVYVDRKENAETEQTDKVWNTKVKTG
ncbi:MAG: hypothetical protein J6C86_09115 [Bacteroidaceae bacterium]|nr:hypothetical protein [Bacteroidaceae bacterium]